MFLREEIDTATIMKKNHPREKGISVLGVPYVRLLVDSVTQKEAEILKKYFSYIVIYSYTKADLPGFILRTQKTPLIDLSCDEESLFRAFRRDAKSGIKKTGDMPDLHYKIPAEDRGVSYQFYKEIKRKDGVVPDIREEFIGCIFFNAYLGSSMIVSMSFYDNGSVLRSKHIVSRRKEMGEDKAVAAHATRRLTWEICMYAKKQGYRFLDLGGIDLSDPAKKGVAEFKLSFGGEIKDVYIYRYETVAFKILRRILHLFKKNIH